MGPDVGSGTARGPAGPAVRGGIVSRRGLFGRLGAAGRVAVVSAPAGRLAGPYPLGTWARASQLDMLVRLGQTEQALAGLAEPERGRAEIRVAEAVLRLTQDDPHAAAAALAPVLDGSAPVIWQAWLAQAFLLEAIARDALGDPGAAGRALQRALDLAGPDGPVLFFLLYPAPGLLQRHARQHPAHAALITQILTLLTGTQPPAAPPAGPQPLGEPLTASETRVLRYLPTDLSAREIAGELYVSHNTVRTHMRTLYGKLGAHRRTEAVDRARALGLLAPSPRRP
jgi:LuxR family transcriptional regulator, maltose regulon positive regulatory protein